MEVFPCPSEIGVESFRQHHSPRRTRIDQIKAQGSLNEKGILPREGKRSITPILARDAWSFVAASKGVLAVVGSIPFSQLSPQCLLSLLVDGGLRRQAASLRDERKIECH
ncbi:hypothetical protein V6N12_075893 [Hibiscus sabdariffa]|uniref:Uncharacterized protein n=1 Tax=Hibiscus sabdariffa TaxID=183260 RepID=A0ABR1Z621_9ROSI